MSLETALVVPLLFCFVVASVDVVKLGYAWLMLTKTARQAAEWASGLRAAGDRPEPAVIEARAAEMAARYGLGAIEVAVRSRQYDMAELTGVTWGDMGAVAKEMPERSDSVGETGDQVFIIAKTRLDGFFFILPPLTLKATATGTVT